jgi:radical SAM protein with 4Fe4S-binding SPASM domain
LVEGASRGAIYDLKAGRVYSINHQAVEILRKCHDQRIDSVSSSCKVADADIREFFDKMTSMGVGGVYFDAPARKPNKFFSEPARFNFLWLELTSACNNLCVHCYSSSDPKSATDTVSRERWLSLIAEARKEGASALQLIGGEPLLVPYWRDLVGEAKKHKFNFVEIFTNGTLIDDDCIGFFKEHGVCVATTVYGADAAVHDRVTRNVGSFDKTSAAIKRLVAAKIPIRVASIISRLNEDEVERIQTFCRSLGVQFRRPDVVRPTGRGDNEDLLPLRYQKALIRPPFRTDSKSFFRARQFNSCFAGKIAITPTGDVLPCIFARNKICGNVMQNSLNSVIWGEALQKCWRTTKDAVEKCKYCEYRYACRDCRPLAQGHDPQRCWLSSSQGCSYDPHQGKWPDTSP